MSPDVIAAEAANDAHDEAVSVALGCAERMRESYRESQSEVAMGLAMGAYITACAIGGYGRREGWPPVHEWIKGAQVPGRGRAS